jgi:hypothetical protein
MRYSARPHPFLEQASGQIFKEDVPVTVCFMEKFFISVSVSLEYSVKSCRVYLEDIWPLTHRGSQQIADQLVHILKQKVFNIIKGKQIKQSSYRYQQLVPVYIC